MTTKPSAPFEQSDPATGTPDPALTNALRHARSVGADAFLELVDRVPPWAPSLDDDPSWLHPIEILGLSVDLTPVHPPRSFTEEDGWGGLSPVEVPVTDITHAGQRFFRLDATAHYLRHRDQLFDREGWWNQDHPILVRRRDGGLRLADGTNRAAAAIIGQRPTLRAYVLDVADCARDAA